MNDTPRTNAMLTAILETHGHVGFLNCPPTWVAFARELERELNAANDRIKRLEEFVDQLTNPKFTRDDLPKEALLQYIKHLEEAGNELYDGWRGNRNNMDRYLEAWRKAKEAKP